MMKQILPCPRCKGDDWSLITRKDNSITTELKLLKTIKCNSCGFELTRNKTDDVITAWNEGVSNE